MSKNKINVPEAKSALDRFKMEAAKEVGVQSPLKQKHTYSVTKQINIMCIKAVFDLQRRLLNFMRQN